MAKFITCTDDEQAMWLVRSYFLFAEMGIDKAFVFFFNDDDKPSFHACSGITRRFQPKPAYHAIAWMLGHLADYRFSPCAAKIERRTAMCSSSPPRKLVPQGFSPHGMPRADGVPLDLQGATVGRGEIMPLRAGEASAAQPKPGDLGHPCRNEACLDLDERRKLALARGLAAHRLFSHKAAVFPRLHCPLTPMKSTMIRLTLVLLALGAVSLIAQVATAKKSGVESRLAQALQLFPDADTNKDGTLSIDEALLYVDLHPGGEGQAAREARRQSLRSPLPSRQGRRGPRSSSARIAS